MIIIENINYNANMTLKDAANNDTPVAYLTGSINGETQNYSINVNVTNKTLLNTVGAVNLAGESAIVQYTQFETAVKNGAKQIGYKIFA